MLQTLLARDKQLIQQELKQFLPHFMALLSKIQNSPLGSTIKKELSGIYGTEEADKRVVRLFYCNWTKKVYNYLKQNMQIPKFYSSLFSSSNSMRDEKEEE